MSFKSSFQIKDHKRIVERFILEVLPKWRVVKYLGSGSYGHAYQVSSKNRVDRVIKVTSDEAEYSISSKIKTHDRNGIGLVEIYETYELKIKGSVLYVIFQELVDTSEKQGISLMYQLHKEYLLARLDDCPTDVSYSHLRESDGRSFLPNRYQVYQIVITCRQLGITSLDLHKGNMGFSKDNWKLFDIRDLKYQGGGAGVDTKLNIDLTKKRLNILKRIKRLWK